MHVTDRFYDAIIVGGGPAGLSAALALGRCRRRVLLFDDGRPRNAASPNAHGFFTRDGTAPDQLRQLGREQLAQYDVRILDERVAWASPAQHGFAIRSTSGTFRARKLLLATGIVDEVPALPGLSELYGRSVFHCPLCDGWEWRERQLAAYGNSASAVELALALTVWSPDVVLCTDGWTALSARHRDELAAHDVALNTRRVAALEGSAGQLHAVLFADGERVPRDALFFAARTAPRSQLAAQLGCASPDDSAITTDPREQACRDGVYVIGDASQDVNFIAVAVAEGFRAGCAANRALRQEDTAARLATRVRRASA